VIVLALDTTVRDGSVAVVEDGRVRAELIGDATRTHGERLPGDFVRVLDTAGVRLEAVDLLAVAGGPGSFTGLRVGIAAIQGLSTAIARRIVPVSTLDALAAASGHGDGLVGVWMDAQRGQVYAALYSGSTLAPEAILPPSAAQPLATLEAWAASTSEPIRLIGDGAVRYVDVVRTVLGTRATVLPHPPLAGVIGRLACAHPERAVAAHGVVPVYVRRPDAELARLRRGGDGVP
jgi:tRNA threonylcarbamoyladenosine biosynthesis protein TsaB